MLDRSGDDRYSFSFSGLKTAVVNHVRRHPDVSTADVAASFQEAVVDVLVTKARRAAREVGAKGLCLGGGVAANTALRARFTEACAEDGIRAFVPSRAMCTDQRRDDRGGGGWCACEPTARRPWTPGRRPLRLPLRGDGRECGPVAPSGTRSPGRRRGHGTGS